MKKVISLAVCFATVASYGATELIKNGTFSTGTTNWTLGEQWNTSCTGKSTMSVQNGEMVITVEKQAKQTSELNLTQVVRLEQGKHYKFSFDCRLLDPSYVYQPFIVVAGGYGASIGNIKYYENETFQSVLADKTRRSVEFTMHYPTDNAATLHIDYGNLGGGLVIDNVSLQEINTLSSGPVIALISQPYNDSNMPCSSRPTFAWVARDDSGIDHYIYSVDGGTGVSTTETSLTLPYDLAGGTHSFSVYPVTKSGEIGYSTGCQFYSKNGAVPVAPQTLSRSAVTTVSTNSNGLLINTANNSPMELNITNVAGRVVYSSTVTPSNNAVLVSNTTMGLASGVYMLSIKDMSPDSSPISMKISL